MEGHLARRNRVGVVRAAPRSRSARRIVGVDDVLDRAVRAHAHEEEPDDDDEDVPRGEELPREVAVRSRPVVVQPHCAL